jgi:hypothetical protein
MPHRDAPRWNFIHQADGNWIWQRTRAGEAEDWISEAHADFGKLLADAIRHGFVPEGQFWAVTQKRWSTHFAPGAAPTTVALGPDELQSEQSSRRRQSSTRPPLKRS